MFRSRATDAGGRLQSEANVSPFLRNKLDKALGFKENLTVERVSLTPYLAEGLNKAASARRHVRAFMDET